jgi:hypothetical protein
MDSQSRNRMGFNLLFGAAFALAGIGALISGEFAVGGALFSVSAAFLLFVGEARPWADLPRWKRLVTLGLVFVGAVFLVIALITAFGG